jgi:hypothetical protein
LKDKLEWVKPLDLEVFDDALSFGIKNIGVKIFESMTMFDGVMDRLLTKSACLNIQLMTHYT